MLKELVLKPLGLKRSYLFPTEVMVHRFAVGHTTFNDQIIVLRPWQLIRAAAAAGGIVGSITDQTALCALSFGDGTNEDGDRILSRDSMLRMQTPAPATCDFEIGLAWRIRDIGGGRRVFHGGGTFGQVSLFTLVRQRRYAFVLATNSMGAAFLARDVARDLIMQFLGNDEPDPSEINMYGLQLFEYCERYSAALGNLEIDLLDGKLMIQPRPKGGFPTGGVGQVVEK